jgi:hypothetical protein
MKETIFFLVGCIVGLGMQETNAQTYVVTTPQGNVAGYIQQNGQTVNVLGPNGNPVSPPLTAYPNQIVAPSGMAVGAPAYTVPMQPPSPPTIRVLQ